MACAGACDQLAGSCAGHATSSGGVCSLLGSVNITSGQADPSVAMLCLRSVADWRKLGNPGRGTRGGGDANLLMCVDACPAISPKALPRKRSPATVAAVQQRGESGCSTCIHTMATPPAALGAAAGSNGMHCLKNYGIQGDPVAAPISYVTAVGGAGASLYCQGGSAGVKPGSKAGMRLGCGERTCGGARWQGGGAEVAGCEQQDATFTRHRRPPNFDPPPVPTPASCPQAPARQTPAASLW